MRSRTIIKRLSLWPCSPVFIMALLSTAALCWWLAPEKFNDSAVVASAREDETDAALQRAVSEALGEREGTIIVMDMQTGRVRAVANSRLAFEQAFSPGSTIKPFTALAGLRAGLINGKSRLLCRDRYASDLFEINCSHTKIGAPFDLVQAIAYSCNYYFGKLGERLDEDTFNATLVSFGFGKRTGAGDEREAAGSLQHAGRMKPGNALGEGSELRVTPVQLITAYAALLNGGHLYAPQVARAQGFKRTERASLNITPAHRAVLIEGMRGAVVYGTAERAGLDHLPLHIFGKTGTATASDQIHTEGWFVGFASDGPDSQSVPPEALKLGVLVFLRNTHGAECAESARPVFEAFINEQNRSKPLTKDSNAATPSSSSASTLLRAPQVRVYLASEGRVVSVSFEDYVLGVLATEGATESEPEALKALAVSIRTYALRNLKRHEHEGYDFCSTTHCQRYTLISSGESRRVSEAMSRAFTETAGEVLLDENGEIADAYFHAACGGMTADVEKLWGSEPHTYLRGVRDEYCASMPHRKWTDVITATRLAEALRSDSRTDTGARLSNLFVSKKDRTGRAELITLEGERRLVVRGWDFKIIVGRALGWNVLKSSRFEVTRAGANFIFRGSGFGHGLGLCQEGAHVMAERASPYRQILGYYFPATSVGLNEIGLRPTANAETWKADVLTQSQGLSLTSVHFHLSYPPGVNKRDAAEVLQVLEEARASLLHRLSAARLGFDVPQTIEVVLHATTGDFTSATGQSWWAAAAARGNRIELQPLGVLRRRGVLYTTLRHEYAHVVIDALSHGRAPRWLAEGLAIRVAGEGPKLARFKTKERLSTDIIEERLTEASSAEEMRYLYAEAYRQVEALVRLNGEPSVWRRVAQKE